MKVFAKIISVIIISLFFYSCEKKKGFASIIEEQTFDKKDYYEYSYPYYLREDQPAKQDSFKPTIYSNVPPMKRKDSLVLPIPIFEVRNLPQSKNRAYFYDHLDGKSVVYFEKNKKIIYRNYFQDFSGENYNKKEINKPRNLQDLEAYFKSKNIAYKYLGSFDYMKSKLWTTREKELEKLSPSSSKTYDFFINKNFYRITVDSSFIESQMFYNQKDTLSNIRWNSLELFR